MAKTKAEKIQYQRSVQEAVRLRAILAMPYSDIIEEVTDANKNPVWTSISACQKAVSIALATEFSETVETARQNIVTRNEKRVFDLMAKFEKNKSVLISREIGRIDDSTARLLGANAPVKIAETDSKGNDKPKVIVYLPNNHRD